MCERIAQFMRTPRDAFGRRPKRFSMEPKRREKLLNCNQEVLIIRLGVDEFIDEKFRDGAGAVMRSLNLLKF
jgi:hypothetical protein